MTLVRPSVAVLTVVLTGGTAYAQTPASVTTGAQAATSRELARREKLLARIDAVAAEINAALEHAPKNDFEINLDYWVDLRQRVGDVLRDVDAEGDADFFSAAIQRFKTRIDKRSAPRGLGYLILKGYYARGERILAEMQADFEHRSYAGVNEKWRGLQGLCDEMIACDELYRRAADDLRVRGKELADAGNAAQEALLKVITSTVSLRGMHLLRPPHEILEATEAIQQGTFDLPDLVRAKQELTGIDVKRLAGLVASEGKRTLAEMEANFGDESYTKVVEEWETLKIVCVCLSRYGDEFRVRRDDLFARGQALHDRALMELSRTAKNVCDTEQATLSLRMKGIYTQGEGILAEIQEAQSNGDHARALEVWNQLQQHCSEMVKVDSQFTKAADDLLRRGRELVEGAGR